jgi:hypothetical protein
MVTSSLSSAFHDPGTQRGHRGRLPRATVVDLRHTDYVGSRTALLIDFLRLVDGIPFSADRNRRGVWTQDTRCFTAFAESNRFC